MRLRVLGCSGGCAPGRAPSSYLLDGGVAVDAGALATSLTVEEQRGVTDVFLTHAHWDHTRDLPLTVINRDPNTAALRVHAIDETMVSIRKHLMNDEVWFAAFDLPSVESPYIEAHPIAVGETRECNGYSITPFPVPHTIPAVSYVIDDGSSAIVISGDTGGNGGGPSVFEAMPETPSPLKAVFLEASFPNEFRDFAALTGHLTPEMLGEETAGLDPSVLVLATHMKPGFEDRLTQELEALGRPNLRPCRDGEILEF